MSPPPPPAQRSGVRCPRCDSSNTKFCYYNNYSLSQPRHFCKTCRRYWTQGGTLRNIPVGGPSRKIKKPSSSTSAAAGIDPLAGISPAVDFQVAGSGLYPSNLSPFGDPHPHHLGGAAGGGGGPLLDLLRGFPFYNNNNNNFGDQIYYWKQLQQQQRIALPLLYGGGGSLDNKDKNYQKNEGGVGVGPADVMASKPILLFGNQEVEVTNPHSYHDHDHYSDADFDVGSNGEEHQMMMMSTPSAATTQWLFGGGESSNNKNERMASNSSTSGNARSVNLKRWMSW